MKKDEILQRSRIDYLNGDELEKSNIRNSEYIANFIITTIIIILSILSDFHVITGTIRIYHYEIAIQNFLSFLFILSLLIEFIGKYYYTRKKRYAILSITFFLLLIINKLLR